MVCVCVCGGGGGVEWGSRDQISDIGPPKNQISDNRPPKKIKYQISQQISDIWPLPVFLGWNIHDIS